MFDISRYYNKYPYFRRGYGGYNPMVMKSCLCRKSYFRVINALNLPLNVQVNEILMAENLKMGEFTKYIKLSPSPYRILLHSVNDDLLFESVIDIDDNLAYTGVISADIEDCKDISILMIPEQKVLYMGPNASALRFANFCGDEDEIVLSASDGTILFSGLKYGKASCNVAIPSGRYVLNLERSDGTKILEHRLEAAPYMHYTLFASGKEKDGTIRIIVPEDGVNYLDLC